MGDSGDESSVQWAINLFTPNDRYVPFYITYWGEIICTAGGFLVQRVTNGVSHLPPHANVRGYILYTALGFLLGKSIMAAYRYHYGQTDAAMMDYIKRHPDRFPPPPEKPLYRDVFEPWIPIR